MAIALIQSKTDTSGALSLAFNADNTAGNMLIVLATCSPGMTPDTYTISDTRGNTYVTLPSRYYPIGGFCQLFYAFNSAAGSNTITLASTGPQLTTTLALHEFSGVSALDVHAAATGSGTSQDSGPITTNFANALLFGYEASAAQAIVTPGIGWTQAEGFPVCFLTQYKVVSAIGTYNSTTTSTTNKGGACNWAEEILAFYSSASSPVPRTSIIEF